MGSEVVDRSESSSEMESERRVQGLEGGLELERKAGVRWRLREGMDVEREEYDGDGDMNRKGGTWVGLAVIILSQIFNFFFLRSHILLHLSLKINNIHSYKTSTPLNLITVKFEISRIRIF